MITLSWSAVSNASSYIVEGSNKIDTDFTDISSTGSFATARGTTTWTKSIQNSFHFYRVRPVSNSVPDNSIFVEGGTFNIGRSTVTVSSFYLEKYEVTQANYRTVVGREPRTGCGTGDNYPIYYMYWIDAIEYCNRRSMQDGLTPCYSYISNGIDYGNNINIWFIDWNSIFHYDNNYYNNISCDWTANGYRLPTEAEWEFAARGGNLTHNYTYSGSNDANVVAWYYNNSGNTSHPVGTKATNELGINDMTGNVWEWTWDFCGDYPSGPQINPHGPEIGEYRAVRGGCWGLISTYGTVSARGYDATYSNYDVGFRVCRNEQLCVLAPIFSPPSGSYLLPQTVTITSNTPGATIRYTTDGSTPSTTMGTVYISPITVDHSQTIKAIAYKSGLNPSSISAIDYMINLTVTSPTFTLTSGAYTTSQTVGILCSVDGAQIRYTTDGSDPISSSALYSVPISITQTTILQAKAFKAGWTPSETVTAYYAIILPNQANFAFIAGGTYNNGTSDVTVSSFYLDKYEMTQAGYQAVMGMNPSSFPSVTNGPVETVSWFNAIEYCNRRSMNEGLTPYYRYNDGTDYGTNPANWPVGWNGSYYHFNGMNIVYSNNSSSIFCNMTEGYHLPTSSEWEFAAMGGNQTHNYTYSGSNDINTVAWYLENWGFENNDTHAIGTKSPNEFGLFDMSGNVAEWCWDIILGDPMQSDPGYYHSCRGGSWGSPPENCLITCLNGAGEACVGSSTIGFRVCRYDQYTVDNPVISPSSGTYLSPQTVTISSNTPGATIRYTTDGSLPSPTSGTIYSSPFTVSVSQTIKAVAYKTGWTISAITKADYIINLTVSTPTFTLTSGVYSSNQTVSILCATEGAQIHYTINGSEPTESSALYQNSISITSTTILKAKAYQTNWANSQTATAVYTFYTSFVRVEGGTFNNGTSNVTISSFYVDKYEITQYAYLATMGTNPSSHSDMNNLPVEYVTWFNAIEYCNRRSLNEGLTPSYSYASYGTNPTNWPVGWNTNNANHINVSCNWTGNGYRLLTEMEWMYAARGGNQTHNYTYSGSNDCNAVAWYYSFVSYTHIVGTKTANELGLYDMSGNVEEWVWDIYASSYPSGAQNNPHGSASGSYRMKRGGSIVGSASNCAVTWRNWNYPTGSGYFNGFRVCRIAQ